MSVTTRKNHLKETITVVGVSWSNDEGRRRVDFVEIVVVGVDRLHLAQIDRVDDDRVETTDEAPSVHFFTR